MFLVFTCMGQVELLAESEGQERVQNSGECCETKLHLLVSHMQHAVKFKTFKDLLKTLFIYFKSSSPHQVLTCYFVCVLETLND